MGSLGCQGLHNRQASEAKPIISTFSQGRFPGQHTVSAGRTWDLSSAPWNGCSRSVSVLPGLPPA